MSVFEMGGYLPLELHEGRSYFSHVPQEKIFEVNTGRTAIWCAIESLDVRRLLVPAYYCPDIISMLQTLDIQLDFYRIGPDFMPINVDPDEDTAIILVDYFGVVGEKLLSFGKQFKKVIFDFAHSFFTPPVLRDGIMNVYSCRKFLGVCDGAYVIGNHLKKPTLEQDVSSSRAIHLFKSMELGTNAAYQENKANEEILGEAQLKMSAFTQRILDGIDYERVMEKRRKNYRFLQQQLKDLQLLSLPEDGPVPYMYPLLLDRDIHKQLVAEHIYVPVLWSQLLEPQWDGSLEQTYSANIVPLPLDQRYDESHLEKMVQIIKQIVVNS